MEEELFDTDTRNSSVEMYSSLMKSVTDGVALAIADYPRLWHEGNLTNHVVRPMLAAIPGVNIRQPIAGDYALSNVAVNTLLDWLDNSPEAQRMHDFIDGYGIDVTIVLRSLEVGRIVSVPFTDAKKHAASFPHFHEIFRDEVAVLLSSLHSCALMSNTLDDSFRIIDEKLSDERYHAMLARMDLWLTEAPLAAFPRLSDALLSGLVDIMRGCEPNKALARIWPSYVAYARDYIVTGHTKGIKAAQCKLADGLKEIVQKLRTFQNTSRAGVSRLI